MRYSSFDVRHSRGLQPEPAGGKSTAESGHTGTDALHQRFRCGVPANGGRIAFQAAECLVDQVVVGYVDEEHDQVLRPGHIKGDDDAVNDTRRPERFTDQKVQVEEGPSSKSAAGDLEIGTNRLNSYQVPAVTSVVQFNRRGRRES